jgi:hypothetical protein
VWMGVIEKKNQEERKDLIARMRKERRSRRRAKKRQIRKAQIADAEAKLKELKEQRAALLMSGLWPEDGACRRR